MTDTPCPSISAKEWAYLEGFRAAQGKGSGKSSDGKGKCRDKGNGKGKTNNGGKDAGKGKGKNTKRGGNAQSSVASSTKGVNLIGTTQGETSTMSAKYLVLRQRRTKLPTKTRNSKICEKQRRRTRRN